MEERLTTDEVVAGSSPAEGFMIEFWIIIGYMAVGFCLLVVSIWNGVDADNIH